MTDQSNIINGKELSKALISEQKEQSEAIHKFVQSNHTN